MDSLGTRLRRAREGRGASLSDIALSTKASVTVLEALERDDFSRLPQGILGRSIVRAYATAVGLDPAATVQAFRDELSRHDPSLPSDASATSTSDEGERRATSTRWQIARLVVGVSALIAVAMVVWVRVAHRPLRAGAVSPAPSVQVTPESAPPANPPVPAPINPPAPVRPLTLDFAVTGACWVQVVADGRPQVSRTVAPGEQLSVPADRELEVTVGNAAAFIWRLNGREARALGGQGVVRTVRVTLDNFTSFLQ